jgi:Pyridoxamine 5'-phosphate oxidase
VGKVHPEIDERLAAWIAAQPLFFVGSAPLDADGHVNVSPKGPIGTLRVLSPTEVAYLDVVGSGAETAAHLQENGRIVVMLCAFSGPPRIVRLHGRGTVVWSEDPEFDALLAAMAFDEPDVPEARRAIIRVAVTRVADSCGFGVPLMDVVGERSNAAKWARGKLAKDGPGALDAYKAIKNTASIDGLPAWPAGAPAPAPGDVGA